MKKSNSLLPSDYIGFKSYVAALVSLISFGLLHFFSPEFAPSWRMVSEYAMGNYWWLASLMFAAMATSCAVLCYGLRRYLSGWQGKIGNTLLGAAAIGLYLAAIFGLPHPLHGLSALIGIPSLTISMVLLSLNLAKQKEWQALKKVLYLTANTAWISLIAMFSILFIGLSSTENQFGPAVPVGYPNRLLMISYAAWLMIASWPLIAKKSKK